MHCSSYSRLLDAYVEGELTPARTARVAAHLAACEHCAAVLERLRAIDGLLLAPRQLEPAPNFTFAVMAEARALAAPRPQRMPHLAVLATYIVFAWVAIGAFLVFGGNAARAAVAFIGASVHAAGRETSVVAMLTGHVFGPASFDVTAAMGGIFAIDLVAAAAVVAVYGRFRARRTFHGDFE